MKIVIYVSKHLHQPRNEDFSPKNGTYVYVKAHHNMWNKHFHEKYNIDFSCLWQVQI